MYKKAGKFWARNRSLAKRAISAALHETPSKRRRTKTVEPKVADQRKAKPRPRTARWSQRNDRSREQRGEVSLFYLRCLLKEKQDSIASLKEQISDRQRILQPQKTVRSPDKQDKKLCKMIKRLDALRSQSLDL